MNMGLQIFVSILIVAMAIDCMWNSKWTLNLTKTNKIGAATVIISAISLIFPFLPKPSLSDVVLNALKEIDDSVGGKEEFDLRTFFGFNQMFQINMVYAKEILQPSSLTQEEKNELAVFRSQPCQSLVDIRYGKFYIINDGAVRMEDIPGKIKMIYLPFNYVAGRELLEKYKLTAQVPPDVASKIKDLDDAIQGNANLLLDVLNEEAKANPLNVISNEDANSPFSGVTSSVFWKRFTPLKPKEEAIISSIRPYLKTN